MKSTAYPLLAVLAIGVLLCNAQDWSDESGEYGESDESDFGAGRMVGGRNATAANSPFVVSLQTGMFGHFCGGAIINRRWILTAASCTRNRQAGSIIARVGALNHDSGGQVYEVRRVVAHHNYNTVTLLNDISTVQTVKNIEFDNRIKPIQLSFNAVPLNTQLTIFGWGRPKMRPSAAIPRRLQFIRSRTITNVDCQMRLRASNLAPNVFYSTMCTAPQSTVGVCWGVGGGPVVVANKLVGIVSQVTRCNTGAPDLLIGVEHYSRWIVDNSR